MPTTRTDVILQLCTKSLFNWKYPGSDLPLDTSHSKNKHTPNILVFSVSVSQHNAEPASRGLTGSVLCNTLTADTDARGHRSTVHGNDTGWQLRKSGKRRRAGGVMVVAATALVQVRHVSRRLWGISAVYWKEAPGGKRSVGG